MTMAPPERRTSPRIAFRVPCHITTLCDGAVYKGYVMNLSENGAFVQMVDHQPPLEDLVRMRFRIPPGINCDAAGTVARVMRMGTGQGIGVELSQVNDSFCNFLRNLRSANEQELLFFIRDMGRIEIWIGPDR